MYSLTEENYLKGLLYLSNENRGVNANKLSKYLNIKMPTVNNMIKRLSEKGLVFYESYKPIRLTDQGKKQAYFVVRKHRLTEMFLVEKMNFGWEEVHEIAEQIEHIQSFAFFEKMDKLLGYPKFDPHGSPIPDKKGRVKLTSYMPLSDCKTLDTVIVKAVSNDSAELLSYLSKKDIKLGIQMKILSVSNFDEIMTVAYGKKKRETLSAIITEKILVQN